jgi:toxin ParE1/3/4
MAARVREVVWAQSARDALDEVIEYIARDSRPTAALQVLEEALRAAASLATLSERGRIVRELNDPAIRELLVFKYRLLYEVEDHRVLIVAFLHGARDFATWWQTQQRE